MSTARILPVTQEDVSDDLRPLLRQIAVTGDWVPNVSTTMAHNPGLFRPFLGFGEHFITKSNLPDRERELAVMRTAKLCGCDYIWAHHGIFARTAGLTEEEIDRVNDGPAAPGWSDGDRQILEVVDELLSSRDLDDPAWAQLTSRWNNEQIVEFVMSIGFYAMSAMALNAFRTQIEPQISDGHDGRIRAAVNA